MNTLINRTLCVHRCEICSNTYFYLTSDSYFCCKSKLFLYGNSSFLGTHQKHCFSLLIQGLK
uniref:Uncharacterized protein n=1 Tax=Anguilla anguilla TaxID=7936 RepID=A0A0E9R241_ANGAN